MLATGTRGVVMTLGDYGFALTLGIAAAMGAMVLDANPLMVGGGAYLGSALASWVKSVRKGQNPSKGE